MTSRSPVRGYAAPGYDSVVDEFRANFEQRGDLGAAFAAFRGSELLVDLWGGIADRRSEAPWKRDTLTAVFSGTKGLVAVCMLILLERRQLELDEAVARYWPAFAAAGKEGVLVRDVVSHRAGLPAVAARLEARDVLEPERVASMLAAQPPLAEARARVYYHTLTFGWLCGELVRRVDGRTIGRFFDEEVARPLGLELWIGLPVEHDDRVATLELASTWGEAPEQAAGEVVAELRRGNPPLFEREGFSWNRTAFRRAEIAGAGGIGSPASMAKLYACLAAGGEIEGVRIMGEETVRLGRRLMSRGRDPVSGLPLAFGVGFEVQTELSRLGPPLDAFGHTGAGGSVHGAWPTEGVGFSYAMNLMRDDPPDRRAGALLEALYDAVRG